MPPDERRLRAVFFDAGNTLLRMNYVVIAAELGRHGVRAAPGEVQRAEWRARVRLDDEVLSRSGPGDSTENRSTAERYLGYLLDGLRVAPGEAAYIGDLYSIDVRGARAAGMRAVLLDPGGHWGSRDCPLAPDLPSAVRIVLAWR